MVSLPTAPHDTTAPAMGRLTQRLTWAGPAMDRPAQTGLAMGEPDARWPRQLDFLLEAGRLKQIERMTRTVGGSRRCR